MNANMGDTSDEDKRSVERRRLIDLTRPEKGLPERRALGTDRRADRDTESDDTGSGGRDQPSGPPADAGS